MNQSSALANFNKDTDFIQDHPVSFASELIYFVARSLEGRQNVLNQSVLKSVFIDRVLHSDQKPIHLNISYQYKNRTDSVFIYHHANRESPYLLLVIDFIHIPIDKVDVQVEQHVAVSDHDQFKQAPSQLIEDALVNKRKQLLEDTVYDIRKNGFSFFSDTEHKDITLHSAICAVVCSVGSHITYEIYDPSGR